jgi:hypothetical protein
MSFQLPALQLDVDGKPLGINQRASIRYQCAPATPGKILASDREEFQRGWVIDLSKTGAGILMNRPMNLEQTACLQITSPTDNKRYEFRGKVVHATQRLRGGEWIIGFHFDHTLTDEQLEILL